MRFKMLFVSTLSVTLLALAVPASPQVAPAAHKGEIEFPFTVGAGAASYDVDWNQGRMVGVGAWADWRPNFQYLSGLGLELEARDISWDAGARSGFAQRTIGVGPSYASYYFPGFHPYAKYLFDYGRTSFSRRTVPPYTHFDGYVRTPGLGFELRLVSRLWMRVDYEYQFWPQVNGGTPNPQGFTVGATWHLAKIY